MVSVWAVDLSATGDDAARLRSFLATAAPQVRVIAATGTRVVAMDASYDGDDFVMAGGALGGDTVTAVSGPASQLPEQLVTMLLTLGEATSVPAVPRFTARPVPVPDALVLAQDLAAGGLDDLPAAVHPARSQDVPTWLRDLAHGVSAAFLVLVVDRGRTRWGTHLIGLPSGWGHLQEVDDALCLRPAELSQIRAELQDICLVAAASVRTGR